MSSGWRVREPVWSTAAAIGTRPFVQRLAAGLRRAELNELPALVPAVPPMILGEVEPVYALHRSERTRPLFWEDRQ